MFQKVVYRHRHESQRSTEENVCVSVEIPEFVQGFPYVFVEICVS